MTHTNTNNTHSKLPALSLDYQAGRFANTLTGEAAQEVVGIPLAYRNDRVLYPTAGEAYPLPLCVNGSEYGPCLCQWAQWGPQGEPPECTEELTMLLWMDEGAQVVTLTARRSQVKTLEQYLGMKAALSGVLHDQRITIRMTPEGGLHRLTLLPGETLPEKQVADMAARVERVSRLGAWETL